jgi:hypothetical protein
VKVINALVYALGVLTLFSILLIIAIAAFETEQLEEVSGTTISAIEKAQPPLFP